MMPAHHPHLTELLQEWSDGDGRAVDRIVDLLYDELREIAHRHLTREATGHTVQTTALVHEAYLGLVDQSRARWQDRTHFLATASRVMRHILVDHARSRGARKRGGDRIRVPLQAGTAVADPPSVDLLDLDRALQALAEQDARMARVVECRFFGGMTDEETAHALDVSPRTVRRTWTRARLHLLRALEVDAEADGPGGDAPGTQSRDPKEGR